MRQSTWKRWKEEGGDEYWIDSFFAKHLVLLYYWIMVGYYLADPSNAYDINMKIEKHAFETYTNIQHIIQRILRSQRLHRMN